MEVPDSLSLFSAEFWKELSVQVRKFDKRKQLYLAVVRKVCVILKSFTFYQLFNEID